MAIEYVVNWHAVSLKEIGTKTLVIKEILEKEIKERLLSIIQFLFLSKNLSSKINGKNYYRIPKDIFLKLKVNSLVSELSFVGWSFEEIYFRFSY
jgi:hypothetical protein